MAPHFDITVDATRAEPEISTMLKTIKPDWPHDKLQFKVFSGGLTNYLVGAHAGDEDEMILFRVFGPGSEVFIDREREMKALNILAQQKVSKAFYGTFQNGCAFGFVPGRTMELDDCYNPEMADLVAIEMGRLHAVRVPDDFPRGKRGSFFPEFENMVKLLPDKISDDPELDKVYQKEVRSINFLKELAEMEKIADSMGEEMVMCHHDIMPENIVISKDNKRAHIIDFEYVGLDYGSIDIAVYYICHINIFEPDTSKYPKHDQLYRFVKVYLQELFAKSGKNQHITDDLIETWIGRIQKMALVAWLYWGLWCVLQKFHSTVDFDWLGLGVFELKEYKRLKPFGMMRA